MYKTAYYTVYVILYICASNLDFYLKTLKLYDLIRNQYIFLVLRVLSTNQTVDR